MKSSAAGNVVDSTVKTSALKRRESTSRAEAKAATRSRLIDAALRYIGSNAGSVPTVSDVVKGAGVSSGTFYLHFDSVQQLIDALQREALRRLGSGISREASAEAAIAEYVGAAVKDRATLRALWVAEAGDEEPSPLESVLRDCLERSGAAIADARSVAVLLRHAIEQAAVQRALADEDEDATVASLMYLLEVVQDGLERDRSKDLPRAATADKVVLVCGDRRLTGAELDDRVGHAITLLEGLGFQQNDRFGMLMTNSVASVELDLASQRMGMSAVPLNTYWRTTEIEHVVRQSGVHGIAFHEEFRSLLDSIDPAMLKSLILLPVGAASSGDRYEHQIQGLAPTTVERTPPATTLYYTSGSTGLPKGISRSESPAERRRHGLFLASLFDIGENDQMVVGGPLHHAANRLFANVCRQVGATTILMPHFGAEEMLELIERERATAAMVVPTMLYRLVKLDPQVRERHDLSSLRAIVHMGAPCSAELKRQALEAFGPTVYEYYGTTEMGGTVIGPEEWLRHPGSVGRAWRDDTSVKILDPDGNELPPDVVGHVALLDPQRVPFRYLDEHGQPEAPNGGGELFVTDDLGYIDREGYLYLADRHSAVFKSGGVAVYPAEVEAVIAADPAVADCAVAGVPDPEWGQVPIAFLQPLPGRTLDIDRLRATVRAKLAHYKCPRSWTVVEQIPRNNAGKLIRRELPRVAS